MAVDHYENFPVASWLCPPRLRAPIQAIYWYARTADDLADEGDASPQERLQALADYRAALREAARGRSVAAGRWAGVFAPLQRSLTTWHLPLHLLEALLDAFEQDVRQQRWPDRAALLDYCSRSANPVGRLLLHLQGVTDAAALAQSDAICSALQLANFWQDAGADAANGRIYLPADERQRRGIDDAQVLARQDSAATRSLVLELSNWARGLMHQGAPLVHRLSGRMGWELRLIVQGGIRILDHVDGLGGATLSQRPTVGAADLPQLLWRAWRM